MSARTAYLVTGAARGIGFGLVEALSKDSNNIIFAGVRDPKAASALTELRAKTSDRIHIVKLESGNVQDAKEAAELVQKVVGHIDILIANAGISETYGPMVTMELSAFRKHYEVNTIGPLVLYQAFHELLLRSPTKAPKFIGISTAAASIGTPIPQIYAAAYQSSKASLNFLITRIGIEDEKHGMVSIAISPGWVATDMGNHGARSSGLDKAPVALDDSVRGILKVVGEAKQDTHNGIFWDYTGETFKW